MIRGQHAALLILGGGLLAACRSGDDDAVVMGKHGAAARTSASGRHPVDHLAPDELAPGTDSMFGLLVPRSMQIERRYADAIHATGRVPAEAVANYVRERVEIAHIEIGAARTVFPNAHITGTAPGKVYRIEVIRERTGTQLVVKDESTPKAEPGLSDQERWKRAGMTPDGKQVDPSLNQ